MATSYIPPGDYATIPPSNSPSLTPPTPPSFSASQIDHSITTAIRPWRELLDLSAISLPVSLSEATFRIKSNLGHFCINYAVISLIILLLSLIYHPVAIIVFLITLVAWFYLYFSRYDPLTIFNRTIDDWVILTVLSLATILALILTHVWLNVVVSMAVSAAVACLHAAIRFPEDADYQESPYGALLSVVESPIRPYSNV